MSTLSRLLIAEPSLCISPTLARTIGINEAMVVQQVHYWITNPKVGMTHDGHKWIFNKMAEWVEQLPMPLRTIERTISNLRKHGILVTSRLNASRHDQTNFYRIDYAKLDSALTNTDTAKMAESESANVAESQPAKMAESNTPKRRSVSKTKNTAETTAEITNNLPDCIPQSIWSDFVQYRTDIRKPMTPKAADLMVRKLVKLHQQGENPADLLATSIISGWTDVYPSKGAFKPANANTKKPSFDRTTTDEWAKSRGVK